MDERYDLHKRLQENASQANVSFRSFKNMHHVAYTTFYKFLKNPEIARDKTITSVRLVCDFLEAAMAAGYLPLPKSKKKDRPEEIDRLYTTWWNNGKSFVGVGGRESEHEV